MAENLSIERGAGERAKVNLAFIAAIVAVATIGGFMFGYDSGVINGTQQGLEKAFNLSKLGTGLNVGMTLSRSVAAGSPSTLSGRRRPGLGRARTMR